MLYYLVTRIKPTTVNNNTTQCAATTYNTISILQYFSSLVLRTQHTYYCHTGICDIQRKVIVQNDIKSSNLFTDSHNRIC